MATAVAPRPVAVGAGVNTVVQGVASPPSGDIPVVTARRRNLPTSNSPSDARRESLESDPRTDVAPHLPTTTNCDTNDDVITSHAHNTCEAPATGMSTTSAPTVAFAAPVPNVGMPGTPKRTADEPRRGLYGWKGWRLISDALDLKHSDAPPPRPEPVTTRRFALEGVGKLATPVDVLTGSNQSDEPTGVVLDLCAGCGGMAQAVRSLGWSHAALIDNDQRCINTLKLNGFHQAIKADISQVDFTNMPDVDMITAGLPCQPWSIGGAGKGPGDTRDLWPELVRAVAEVDPKCFLLEMVTGFLRPRFRRVLTALLEDLNALGFTVEVHEVNASDYQTPQSRRRCLLIGHKNGGKITPPTARPASTLRAALEDLGTPNGVNRHHPQGHASTYQKHQPSQLDGYAKTLRAGSHGPGGGNNSILLDSGDVRYFTVREMARVQGFPDHYQFDPVWSHAIKELGNACPPTLAEPWLKQLASHCGIDRQSSDHENHITHFPEPTSEPSAEKPDATTNQQETDRRAELEVIELELKRRGELLHVLQAQATILRDEYERALRQVTSLGSKAAEELTKSLHRKARRVEGLLGPSHLEAMIAAVRGLADDPTTRRADDCPHEEERSRAVRRALKRSIAYGKLATELARERALMAVLHETHDERLLAIETEDPDFRVLPTLDTDSISRLHLMDEANSRREALKEDYFIALDNELRDRHPDDQSNPTREAAQTIQRRWRAKSGRRKAPDQTTNRRKVILRLPRRMMYPEQDDSQPFYNPEIMALPADGEDRYESMSATLRIGDPDHCYEDARPQRAIVDSGAAWCAIKESVLKRDHPDLHRSMSPSRRRFRDAQGGLMTIAGKVTLGVWVGTKRLVTTTYVFSRLGADFLLGVNTIRKGGCIIDGHANRFYLHDDPEKGVPITSSSEPASHTLSVSLDMDNQQLHVEGDPDYSCTPCERPIATYPDVRMVVDSDTLVPPGEPTILAPKLVGIKTGRITDIRMETRQDFIQRTNLVAAPSSIQNPTNTRGVFMVTNDSTQPVLIPRGTVVAHELRTQDGGWDEDTVLVAAVLEDDTADALRGLDEGGIEDLHKLGFSLEHSIDPERRREDGSYEPLSEAKKRVLYQIALRWHYVWARDAKVPKVSFLVILDIPTGDANPQAQQPYPIPAKLRNAAMAEVNKLLKAGLIEPSISDWASPTLVRVKKDSTADEVKIKLAIDYRRVNAVTRTDAGGLGTQSDILYGIGGRYKYLGLCDAAGGFYQYLLSPAARHKSAFILPASMGGTLFQWRVAPYGLTRNPAGYSRGMQWVLKGLHDRRDLDEGHGQGGALSWLDDICMRATTFESFTELFDLVLARLAMAGMSLKGSKCELLHEALDVLGFVATPHGLMMQKPKLKGIMENGVPSNPKEARTFLGAVAFLRRMVPRISLLTAPMTDACKEHERRRREKTHDGAFSGHRRVRGESDSFPPSEQEKVNQSWHAVVDHLDEHSVLSTPEFDDPASEFVLCTDASDFAVGGVLMQWQHPSGAGPPHPPPVESPKKVPDPISNSWRYDLGWELKIIGYYSKTLDEAQRNYPAFDKEAGAILLCIRHWSDLVTYHPTTVYTDSAVAASMLTKHAAPPRLQRWGVELGSYLPHLKIAYRKGSDNGLADLLSRFPAFRQFTATRDEYVELPDDLFDKIGDAPLFVSPSRARSRPYLCSSTYELYEPKRSKHAPDRFWCSGHAPEIPGRGMKDKAPKVTETARPPSTERDPLPETEGVDDDAPNSPTTLPEDSQRTTLRDVANAPADTTEATAKFALLNALLTPDSSRPETAVMLNVLGEHLESRELAAVPGALHWAQLVGVHRSSCGRPPTLKIIGAGDAQASIEREASAVGLVPYADTLDPRFPPDVTVLMNTSAHPPRWLARSDSDGRSWVHLSSTSRRGDSYVRIDGTDLAVSANFEVELPPCEPLRGALAPDCRLRSLLAQAAAWMTHRRLGVPIAKPRTCHARLALKSWASNGYLRLPPASCSPDMGPLIAALTEDPAADEPDGDDPPAEDLGRTPASDDGPNDDYPKSGESDPDEEPEPDTRKYTWESSPTNDECDEDPLDPAAAPAVVIDLPMQLKDPSLRLLIAAARGDPRISHAKREAVLDHHELRSDGLYRRVLKGGVVGRAIVVPAQTRAAILSRFHFSLTDGGGHLGGQALYDQVKVDHYWDGMETECHAFVAACVKCGSTRSQKVIGAPAATAPTPTAPFQVIHVDHKGPLSLSGGYSYVLAVVCALTRFTLFIPVSDTKGRTTLDALINHVFSIFGNPLVIVSDNGSSFANKLMKASERLFGYRQVFAMPHTPQANGMAEAAVKKLKMMLDRHTEEHDGWHRLVPLMQAAVNQRPTKGHLSSPFSALFGRQPVTLAALEQPSLLPQDMPEQREVFALAETLARLHNRLRKESDLIKQIAVKEATPPLGTRAVRRVQPGDKVWLNYSDSERSRYLRKHGHGKPWRHAFIVKEVKPHAVLLDVPTDGSVPDVLLWQSLRKCAFAAPHFHDDSMPLPSVTEEGRLRLAPCEAPLAVAPQPLSLVDDANGWASWTSATVYEIERIVSAKYQGGGWSLMVKWKDYPDATPEPLHKVLKQTNHPGILSDIERCKEDFYAQNPSARRIDVGPAVEVPRRTTGRERHRTDHLIFSLYGVHDSMVGSLRLQNALNSLRRETARRVSAVKAFCVDTIG